jgi:hypothetical protein
MQPPFPPCAAFFAARSAAQNLEKEVRVRASIHS